MRRQQKDDKWTGVYVRVSGEGQRFDSQEPDLRRYLANHGLSRCRWYRDKAGGATFDRPAWNRLLADVHAGRVHTILVWRLDRLGRNLKEGVAVIADLCDKGVRLVSATQPLDLSGTVGKIVAAVLMGVAEMERENINARIRAGIAARKAKGLPMGRRPGQRFKWSPEKRKVDPALARSLRGQGVAVGDIAARFACTVQTVYGALRA